MLCPRFTIGLVWMRIPEKKHQSRELHKLKVKIVVARHGALLVNNDPIKILLFELSNFS